MMHNMSSSFKQGLSNLWVQQAQDFLCPGPPQLGPLPHSLQESRQQPWLPFAAGPSFP